MPRPARVIPNRRLSTTIPETLAVRLDLFLYSDLTGQHTRGPRPGYALQNLVTTLLRQFFDDKELDLSPFLGALPGQHVVRGSAATLSHLITHLTKDSK